MPDGGAKADREVHHNRMNNAIDGLDAVMNKAQRLLDKILGQGQGQEKEKASDPPKAELSLLDVLENGPDRIGEKRDEILSTLSKIESVLF